MKITICGSMYHEMSMRSVEIQLQHMGFEVAKPNIAEGHEYTDNLDNDARLKRGFIDEHLRKIDTSDAILVINHEKRGVDHYIGGNTLIEMAYAYAQGLEIFVLNDIPHMGYTDEIRGLNPIVLNGELKKISTYIESLPDAYISSTSSIKHSAVSRAFRRAGIPIRTVGIPAPSGVSEQPASIDETYEGALHRHELLLKHITLEKKQYAVTIESGIFMPRKEHNHFGTTTIFLEHNGQRYIGIDADLQFPKHMTDRVPRDYKDIGELVKQEYGATTSDPFPYFTNGKITRQQILEDAVYNVLVQVPPRV